MKTERSLYLLLLFLCSLLIVTNAQTPVPANPEPDEDLVLLDVQVVRADTGETVTRVAPGDFRVLENGWHREVTRISQGRWPTSIVILVDVTKSFRPALSKLLPEMESILRQLPERNEIAIVAFGEHAQLMQSFTADRKAAAEQFSHLTDATLQKSLGKKPKLKEGLSLASEVMKTAQPRHRRAIVLLTTETLYSWWPRFGDGGLGTDQTILDSGSAISAVLLTRSMSRVSWVMLFLTAMSETSAGPAPLPPTVRTWATRTGGEVFGGPQEGIVNALTTTLARLNERVVIGFVPDNKQRDNRLRQVQVLPTDKLRQRAGEVEIRVIEGFRLPVP